MKRQAKKKTWAILNQFYIDLKYFESSKMGPHSKTRHDDSPGFLMVFLTIFICMSCNRGKGKGLAPLFLLCLLAFLSLPLIVPTWIPTENQRWHVPSLKGLVWLG